MWLPESRRALVGGNVRAAGTADGGTRAAIVLGPRGTADVVIAGGRTPGAAAERTEGAAGA